MGFTLKNTLPAANLAAPAPLVKSPEPDSEFDYEYIIELVNKFEMSSRTGTRAEVSMVHGHISLVIFEPEDQTIQGYYFADSPTLHSSLELAYNSQLVVDSHGDDFLDRWESFLQVIEHSKIIDADFSA